MCKPSEQDDQPVEPLELLTGAAPCEPHPAPPEPDAAARPSLAGLARRSQAACRPKYKCLGCGYPIRDDGDLRCTECGREHDEDTLRYWTYGYERIRFGYVIWVAQLILVLKLLVLPEYFHMARIAAAIAAGSACLTAWRGKQTGPLGILAAGGVTLAAVLLLVSAWSRDSVMYYLVEMVVACLLVVSMLRDPWGGRIGATLFGTGSALVVMMGAVVFCIAVGVVRDVAGDTAVTLPAGGDMPLLGFFVPHAASVGVWLFAWWALRDVRALLLRRPDWDS